MSEMKIPKDLLWLYGKAVWCNAVISYVSPKHAPGVGVIQPNLVVLIERIASLEAARDERAEQVWRYDKVVEILAADNVALKEKCARLEAPATLSVEEAAHLHRVLMTTPCRNGFVESVEALIRTWLSARANPPAHKEQPCS